MATYSIEVDAIVREIQESGGVIIRGFRSRDELVRSMQSAINSGKKSAFIPTRKALREFLNTEGFVSVMNDVKSRLENHEVLIEANSYDQKHVFAVRPKSIV